MTGWDNGLCQDYDKKLGTWFADRLGAREQLRREFRMTNKLPPLPSTLAAFADTQARHCALNDLVQSYGQLCRDAALEEAAQSLLEAGFRSTGIPAYESLAERVRSLK